MAQHTGVHTLVRRTHEERVLTVLRENGALSRSEMARHVGLSRTTLSEITADLLRRGAIVVVDTDAANRTGSGRPAERLALDPASGQFLGVDLGHRRAHVAVADASREIVGAATVYWTDETPWPERLRRTFDVIDRTSEDRGVHFGALQAVAVGVPGPYRAVSSTDDAVADPWWGSQQVAAHVRSVFVERFGTPVLIDNNVRYAALAEALHAQPQTRDLLYLRLAGLPKITGT